MYDKQQFQQQADFIKEHLDLILDDISMNRDRFLDGSKIFEVQCYQDVAVFSFANWIIPDETKRITYRIFVHVNDAFTRMD